MTGYGRADGKVGGRPVTVEIKSLNHRYKELRLFLPRSWMALEVAADAFLRKRIQRGRVDLNVRPSGGAGASDLPMLDAGRARAVVEACRDLGSLLGTNETPSLGLVAGIEGVITTQEVPVQEAQAWEDLEALLVNAFDSMDGMRQREGAALKVELQNRLDILVRTVSEIEALVPAENAEAQRRTAERIRTLAGQAGVTEDRLAQELAILAERMDVTEELARLRSHFDAVRAMLGRAESAGRELDFLVQEMNREVNTLSSKVHAAAVSRLVVSAKAELEKIREQAQNVE